MTKPNPDSDLDKLIDTALHPERNGLLIKEGVAEGASHEHIIKRELKTALTAYLDKERLKARLDGRMEENTVGRSYIGRGGDKHAYAMMLKRYREFESQLKTLEDGDA